MNTSNAMSLVEALALAWRVIRNKMSAFAVLLAGAV
jgi:hypothetical protein